MTETLAETANEVHSERVAARLGLALATTFTICFLTGLYSHFAQHPSFGFELPARPVGLYRVTQGLHVVTGIASIPLLLAKLWSVYPNLFQWPPFTGIAHAIERLAIFPLVAGSIFMLFTGLANINLWYPWHFDFPTTHYRTAWIVMGALVVHIGAKFNTSRRALRHTPRAARSPAMVGARAERRRFLVHRVRCRARWPSCSRSARRFVRCASSRCWRPGGPMSGRKDSPSTGRPRRPGRWPLLTRRNIAWRSRDASRVRCRSPSTSSAHSRNTPRPSRSPASKAGAHRNAGPGVRVRDLLELAGAEPHASASVESFQPYGSYRTSDLNHFQAHDPDTLLAMQVNGEPLAVDHGYPLRLIAPDRPGVMQTKWIKTLIAD